MLYNICFGNFMGPIYI